MNASSRVYIDVVIIWTMMSFYQQILHSFSCYKVLCIGNLAYAGHFAVYPSNPITCALTGQEHTLLFFFYMYLLWDGVFNCYNIEQCLCCMPITSSVQWGSPIFGQHWGISCCMRDTPFVRWRSTLVRKVTNTVISSLRWEYVLDSVFEEHCARTICLMESYDIKTGCLFLDQDDRRKGREKYHEDIDIWWYSAWQVW